MKRESFECLLLFPPLIAVHLGANGPTPNQSRRYLHPRQYLHRHRRGLVSRHRQTSRGFRHSRRPHPRRWHARRNRSSSKAQKRKSSISLDALSCPASTTPTCTSPAPVGKDKRRPGWRKNARRIPRAPARQMSRPPPPPSGLSARAGTRLSGRSKSRPRATTSTKSAAAIPSFSAVSMATSASPTRAPSTGQVTAATRDPDGGKIDRDESGAPTGILREKAKQLVLVRDSFQPNHENAAHASNSRSPISPATASHPRRIFRSGRTSKSTRNSKRKES